MGGLETLVAISITVKAKRKSKGEKWGQLSSPLNFFSFPDTISVWRPGSRAAQPWLKSTHTSGETGHRISHIKSPRWLSKEITGDGTSQSRVRPEIKSTTHKASSNYSFVQLPPWSAARETSSVSACAGIKDQVCQSSATVAFTSTSLSTGQPGGDVFLNLLYYL